jgi:hypothetical protein
MTFYTKSKHTHIMNWQWWWQKEVVAGYEESRRRKRTYSNYWS